MQRLHATPVGHAVQPGTERLVRGRARKEPPRQGPVVEPRPPHQQRDAPARVNLADARGRVPGKGRCCIGGGWVRDVDEMVRNAVLLRNGDLVGSDVESAIDGGGITVDDLAPEPRRQREAERTLPGGGRAQHGDDRSGLG